MSTTQTAFVMSPSQYGGPVNNDLDIGSHPACSGLGFVGNIDEAKVFNRTLGPQEIRAAYLGSRALPQIAPFDLVL